MLFTRINITTNIAAKIASVNGPLQYSFRMSEIGFNEMTEMNIVRLLKAETSNINIYLINLITKSGICLLKILTVTF